MRPDEAAYESEISRDKTLRDLLKRGGKTALTAAGSYGFSKILPLLNEKLPVDMAMKALDKFSPKIGKFLRAGQKFGLDIREGMDFIKEQMPQEEAKEDRNVIEQYSPELNNFMKEQIGKGRTPVEAGAIAQTNKNFRPLIDRLTKDHNTQWSQIIESVYGKSPKQEALKKFTEHKQKKKSFLEEERERFNEGYGNMNKQVGAQDQALMDALSNILKM
jgi:hypothetical protein